MAYTRGATVTVLPSQPAAPMIEKGIPMPVLIRGIRGPTPLSDAIRTLSKADVGDSILIASTLYRRVETVRESIHRIGGAGWAATRKAEGGVRVWKLAEPDAAKRRKL